MTNKVVTIVENVLCVLLVTIACAGLLLGGYALHNDDTTNEREMYALATVVVELDRENDIVTCEDSNGNLWEFYGCEDWQEGDCASLLMDTCGTASIYDDEVCGTTYGQWTLTQEN